MGAGEQAEGGRVAPSEVDRLRELEKTVKEYLDERDCPAPDFTMRGILLDRMKRLVEQGD